MWNTSFSKPLKHGWIMKRRSEKHNVSVNWNPLGSLLRLKAMLLNNYAARST